jgi:hypothetical protein
MLHFFKNLKLQTAEKVRLRISDKHLQRNLSFKMVDVQLRNYDCKHKENICMPIPASCLEPEYLNVS